MKQVNVWINDEAHEMLVEEAAKRQLISKKVVKISALASELLIPAILNLNDNLPTNQDTNPDTEPITKPETPSDRSLKEGEQPSKPSETAFDFAALDL